jgi:hypothetical protein
MLWLLSDAIKVATTATIPVIHVVFALRIRGKIKARSNHITFMPEFKVSSLLIPTRYPTPLHNILINIIMTPHLGLLNDVYLEDFSHPSYLYMCLYPVCLFILPSE